MPEPGGVEKILFHDPKLLEDTDALLEQYTLFVASSESVVARRQAAHAYFLTLHSLLFTFIGLSGREGGTVHLGTMGMVALSSAGILMCYAWKKTVLSYQQLNRGKFEVIHLLERRLPVRLFEAEWKALGEGKDSSKYQQTSDVELGIPRTFQLVYFVLPLFSSTTMRDQMMIWIHRIVEVLRSWYH